MNKETAIRLVDTCLCRSLTYMAESLTYYYPAKKYKNTESSGLNEIAENNFIIHISRAFTEKGFVSWAEVPFVDERNIVCHFDFLAFDPVNNIRVLLEFKNHLETPTINIADLKRLIYIKEHGFVNEKAYLNNRCVEKADIAIYGITAMMQDIYMPSWWNYPKRGTKTDEIPTFLPVQRTNKDYAILGQALELADGKYALPVIENKFQIKGAVEDEDLMPYRYRSAGYAIYSDERLDELKKVIS